MDDSLPTKSQIDNQHNNNNYNNNNISVGYPKFSDIHDEPAPKPIPYKPNNKQYYDKPTEKQKKKKDYNYPKQQNQPRQPREPNRPTRPQQQQQQPPYIGMGGAPGQYMAVPVGNPVYVPVAQMPYYPGAPMYPPPYPYYGPPPMQGSGNTVIVIPPGYERDYSPGYKPWGDLRDDLRNLF